MNRRSLLVALVAGLPAATLAADAVAEAQRAAATWLALVDAGDYAGTWHQAGELFRNAVPRPQWEQAVGATRQPLGKLVQRTRTSAQAMRTLPGLPEGQYVLLQYEADYANKPSAVESLAVALEPDGQWRVVGYFVK